MSLIKHTTLCAAGLILLLLFTGTSFPSEQKSEEVTTPVEISTKSIPAGHPGDEYSTLIRVSGGSGSYQFSSESLPARLTIDATGTLKGKIKAKPGNYHFTIKVVDTENTTLHHEKPFSLTIFEPITFQTKKLNPATAGETYNQQISVSGGSQTFRFSVDGLPGNLGINDNGIISGSSDAKAGKYTVVITATDKEYPDKQQSQKFRLMLYTPVTISTQGFPHALKSSRLKTKINAVGGSGRYIFSASGLPEGLILSSSGKLTGTVADQRGEFPFDVNLVDKKSGYSTEKKLSLTVVDFFPDLFEKMDDNGFSSNNTMIPGDSDQNHTFNAPGDMDVIKLDLRGVQSNDVIRIATDKLTEPTLTELTLHGSDDTPIQSETDNSTAGYSELFFVCDTPDIYWLQIKERTNETGDYRLSVENPGQKVAITTDVIPDVKIKSPFELQIQTKEGSGSYRFTAAGLPQGLSLSGSGNLTGTLPESAGEYLFTITVADTEWMGVVDEKKLTLTVVDFFPDIYETKGDDTFLTSNTMVPGGGVRNHTFNHRGDTDYVLLDLSSVTAGNVIDIQTSGQTEPTLTKMSLFDAEKKLLLTTTGNTKTPYSQLFYECTTPGIYYLKIEEPENTTGDYGLKVSDTGPKVSIQTVDLPDVLTQSTVSFQVDVTDGSGSYTANAKDLPIGLTMDNTGRISGTVAVPAERYTFSVMVEDTKYRGITTEKKFTWKVVDFFPDAYEKSGDNDFDTATTMTPGDMVQEHTFNHKGDIDYIKLDLANISQGDILDIRTWKFTKKTTTDIVLYDSQQNIVLKETQATPKPESYSRLLHVLETPGIYYLSVSEPESKTGDYSLTVVNRGPKVAFAKNSISDVLTSGSLSFTVKAIHGSGKYRFSALKLPDGLTMDSTGLIKGTVPSASGRYPFTVKVDDTRYPGIHTETELTITVVDFFPDRFETAGDNDFNTVNTLVPGDPVQEHTFNTKGDKDYIKVDLTGCDPGDVIKIETQRFTESTNTYLSLFDAGHKEIQTGADKGKTTCSKIIFHCKTPAIYYLKITESSDSVGDYKLKLVNTGPHIQIGASSIHDVLHSQPYTTQLPITGGSGAYIVKTRNLPENLNVNNKGTVSGKTTVSSNKTYTFTVTAYDSVHSENFMRKDIRVKVVDYYPDSYEVDGDNDFNTSNIMAPGSDQKHNFNYPGDEDYVKLDLSAAKSGDVVIIESKQIKKITDTTFTLFNESRSAILKNDNGGKGNYSKLVFLCKQPGVYFLKIGSKNNKTGAYTLSLNNSGQQLKIATKTVPIAESFESYGTSVKTTGGCGGYKFSVTQGELPKGLSLHPKTGNISGKNTNWGTFAFTVTAKDNNFPENQVKHEYQMEAFMGKKLRGTTQVVFPHYVSGTFSTDIEYTNTQAVPGNIKGGTPGNLRYRIVNHNIPENRFNHSFDTVSGTLNLTELSPVACNQYSNVDVEVELEVKDRLYTNNSMKFRYQIPAKCLTY